LPLNNVDRTDENIRSQPLNGIIQLSSFIAG
jgi:hypothetical protein